MRSDHKRGIYMKYRVVRLNDPKKKHKNCSYFVLDLSHDKFAGPALRAYSDACALEFPKLARDLRSILPLPIERQNDKRQEKLIEKQAEWLRTHKLCSVCSGDEECSHCTNCKGTRFIYIPEPKKMRKK
jgi:hypothetical protein